MPKGENAKLQESQNGMNAKEIMKSSEKIN